jgi:methylmalonyl-CoA/ethylmalonyl-CoA epimerase
MSEPASPGHLELESLGATFDHVAHATRSIRSSLPIFRDLLGGRFIGGGENPLTGFRSIQLVYNGGGKVELIEELEGSDFLGSFFNSRPEGGLHHVTYKVPDIEVAIERVRASGIEPFGVYTSNPQWQELFLHPKVTGGTLVQLAASTHEWGSGPLPTISVEEFLDDPAGFWEQRQ